ncbi:unnamed protein product, partial [marine sediment metagenome]
MKTEWLTIVILIIILIVTIYIITQNNSQTSKPSIRGDFDYGLVSNKSYPYKQLQKKNPPNIAYKGHRFVGGLTSGELNETCPCEEDLICDEGLCKRDTGSICLISKACKKGEICLLDRCIVEPTTYLENRKGRRIVSMDQHLFKLMDNRFVFPGWWKLNNVLSIIDSKISGVVYISTDKGIYRVLTNIELIKSNNQWWKEIKTNGNITGKLYKFIDKIYLLTSNGKLYRLYEETLTNEWTFNKIKEMYGQNISNKHIN